MFMISFLAWTYSPILIFETGSGSTHPTRRVQIGMVCGNFGCRSFGIWGLSFRFRSLDSGFGLQGFACQDLTLNLNLWVARDV